MAEEQRIPRDLDATEQELLTMLQPGELLEKLIARRLTTEHLDGPPLTRRLRSLAKRGLVAHIPAPHGSLWCLTRAGREVAQALWNRAAGERAKESETGYSTGQALQQQDETTSEEAR